MPSAPPEQVARVVELAANVVIAVREDDPSGVHRRLEVLHRHEPLLLRQLVVALAAMVPDDRSVGDLLAWTDDLAVRPACDPRLDGSRPGARSEHGTRSRYVAGCRGEGCVQAQRDYDAARWRSRSLKVVPSDRRTG